MTAPETAALVERLRNMAAAILVEQFKGERADLLAAAALLSRPEPQGTASDREKAEKLAAGVFNAIIPDEWGAAVDAIASALAGERERCAKVADAEAQSLSENAKRLSETRHPGRANRRFAQSYTALEIRDAIRAGEGQGA